MQIAWGAFATLGFALLLWGIAALVAQDTTCATIDDTSFAALSKWSIKAFLWCWL